GASGGALRNVLLAAADLRILPQAHQEGGRRQRRRGEASGAANGQNAARAPRGSSSRRGRCACGGALSCARTHRKNAFARRRCGGEMIGFLKGTLVSKRPPSLTIDVAGVGYEVDAPMSTFYKLPELGE